MYEEDPPVRQRSADEKETEFEVRARSIREKYEERLMGMTDRIRAILEDIKQDEVVATMQQDPASAPFVRARMRELAEEHFSQEREETIDKLVKEVALLHAENQKLDRECAQAKSTARTLEEQFRQERGRLETTEREMRDLRSKSAVSGRQYEETLRKLAEDSSSNLKAVQSEAERLREKLEQSERNVWSKSTEMEMLKQDLEAEKARGTKLLLEHSGLRRAFQELEEDYSKAQNSLQSSSGNSSDLVQKLSKAREDIAALESTVKSYECEHDELKSKYLAYSREFKEVLEAEQKSTYDTISTLQQKHKEKCHLLKKKVLELRSRLKDRDAEIANLHGELEACKESYERSIELMQTDLRRVRDEWERKCAETEQNANARTAELLARHKAQLAAVQQQSQALVDEKVKEMTEELTHQQAKQRQNEADLRRILEEKLQVVDKEYIKTNRHEAIISDEISRVKAQLLADKRNFEEALSGEYSKKQEKLKEEYEGEIARLYQKLRATEEREEAAEACRRKSERELEYANERVEQLNAKVAGLNSEVMELESNKKAVVRHLEEAAVNIGKLKGMYEEETGRRKVSDEQLSALRDKLRTAESSLSQKESELQQEVHSLKLAHIEEATKLRDALEKEQQAARRSQSELTKLRESHEALHTEKRELHETHSKAAEELKLHSIRLKQEGESLYEQEAEEHKETQRLLQLKTTENCELMEAVEDLKENLMTTSSKIAGLKREVEQLNGQIKAQRDQSQSAATEKQRLLSLLEERNSAFSLYKQRARKAMKGLSQQYSSQLSEIQRSLLTDITDFKKYLSKQISESISGVEDLQLRQRRAFTLSILEKEDQIRAAEKKKNRMEQELSESFSAKTAVYDKHIDSLKASIGQLKAEIAGKTNEIADFIQKISDYTQEQARLREENQSLHAELQSTLQELEYSRLESQDLESRLKTSFQEEISGREADIENRCKSQVAKLMEIVSGLQAESKASAEKFTAGIRELQERHRAEVREVEGKSIKIEEDAMRRLQLLDRDRQERSIDIEEMCVEVAAMKVDFVRFADATEEELTELVGSLHNEQEKQSQFRQEKTAELEDFAKRLKAVSRELQEKDENLERTNRDKELLRNQLREIRESQVQREISELKGSLERSVSKEARRGKKADEDSLPENPKIPLSLSQLKASLEKFS